MINDAAIRINCGLIGDGSLIPSPLLSFISLSDDIKMTKTRNEDADDDKDDNMTTRKPINSRGNVPEKSADATSSALPGKYEKAHVLRG